MQKMIVDQEENNDDKKPTNNQYKCLVWEYLHLRRCLLDLTFEFLIKQFSCVIFPFLLAICFDNI